MPKEAEKTHFTLPAKVLQANSRNNEIRELNEEFRMKGGRVSFKSTKKGQNIQLSHDDLEYLEEFRKRLFKECGLPIDEDPTKKKRGRPPKPGSVPEEEESKEKEKTPSAETQESQPGDDYEKRPRSSHQPSEWGYTAKRADFNQRVMNLIEEAVARGAIDDGEVIKYAYNINAKENIINALRKQLWAGRCQRTDKRCRFKRKQMKFEDIMKSCCGVKENCEHVQSDMCHLFDQWKQNMDDMFGEFADKKVKVIGKISYYKFIERDDGSNHYKFLIYDTLVNFADKLDDEPKLTLKLWAKVSEKDFKKFNKKEKFCVEDISHFEGTIIWDPNFFDYWIIDITVLKVHERKGEMPIKS